MIQILKTVHHSVYSGKTNIWYFIKSFIGCQDRIVVWTTKVNHRTSTQRLELKILQKILLWTISSGGRRGTKDIFITIIHRFSELLLCLKNKWNQNKIQNFLISIVILHLMSTLYQEHSKGTFTKFINPSKIFCDLTWDFLWFNMINMFPVRLKYFVRMSHYIHYVTFFLLWVEIVIPLL